MGVRFRKSIKIAPGVKLNLGSKSAGISIGNKYGGVSYNTRTGTRARVSAPGTGLSYSSKIGTSRSVQRRAAGNAQSDSAENYALPSADELRTQAKKYQKNHKFVTITYPIISVLFLLSAIAAPAALLVSALFLFLFFKLRKKYETEIPQLLETADDLEKVADDLSALEKAESDIKRTKSAALFFMNLDTIMQHAEAIMQKAPKLSKYHSIEECRQDILSLFASQLESILQADFEKTYKHLFELKTAKGINSAIEKFSGPYNLNSNKMTTKQLELYEGYLQKLTSVNIPSD